MSSFTEEDVTLPIDFNGSTNPDQLQDTPLGAHLEFSDGSVPKVAKSSSGRMSPVRARTMKDYDQQIAELKKENFSLKLRIFFLEDRMQKQFGSGEDLYKTNIELKVECESLKKELTDKQELLKKASNALETITTHHQGELEKVRQSAVQEAAGEAGAIIDKRTEGLQKQVADLEDRLQHKQLVLSEKEEELAECQTRLDEVVRVSKEVDAAYKQLTQEHQALQDRLHQEIPGLSDDKSRELEAELQAKQAELELLGQQQGEAVEQAVEPLREQLASKDQQIQELLLKLQGGDGAGTDGSIDKPMPPELTRQVDQLQKEMKGKDAMIGRLEDLVREKEAAFKEQEKELGDLQQDNALHEENALKRDKAICGLTKMLQEKAQEASNLGEQLEERDQQLNQLKQDLHELRMGQYQVMEDKQVLMLDKENEIIQLDDALRQQKLETERVQKVLGRKEGEVSRLTAQLEKADSLLRQREDALQELRDQLQDEKQHSSERAETLGQHYQALLDDAQRRVQNLEKMLQRQTQALQDKDSQLQEYVALLQQDKPHNESRDSIINSLRGRLQEKDQALEGAIEEKFKALGEKDEEIRQLKMNLKEKERDIERANQMLLSAEESIDSLENDVKEKNQTVKKLSNVGRNQQRAMEDSSAAHVRALEEKEALIAKLQQALSRKEKNLQDSLSSSPGSSDALVKQLQQRLKEKEQLLQEVLTDRGKAAEGRDSAQHEMVQRLAAKNEELKAMEEQYQQQLAGLARQLQALQAEVNQRDLQLQTMEDRASRSEEQQQEMLDKLKAALNEKEKSIEALVESAQEKDRLFKQMQSKHPMQHDYETSKLVEVQQLKDEVTQLQNQLLNKDGQIERLKKAADQRSLARTDLVPRRHLEEAEATIGERTEALTKALRAEKVAKQQLKELRRHTMDSDPESIEKLRHKVAELEGQLERPGTPQRARTIVGGETDAQFQKLLEDQTSETQTLNKALKTETEIFHRLNQSNKLPARERLAAVESELTATQELRRQLEAGIRRNSRMRQELEQQAQDKKRQLSGSAGASTEVSTEMNRKIQSLQNQLEESKRWNSSLQARLSQQPTHRDGGVGRDSARLSSRQGSLTSPDRGTDVFSKDVSPTFISVETKRSPKDAHTDSSAKRQLDLQDSLSQHSFIPSFLSLPELDLPTDRDVANMTVPELQQTVLKLRDQIVQTVKDHASGRNTPADERETERLEKVLVSVENQKKDLQRQLSAFLQSPKSDSDPQAIPVLKEQLALANETILHLQGQVRNLRQGFSQNEENISKRLDQDMEKSHTLENSIANLEKKLREVENVNELLKRQISLNSQSESAPSGFNPELIVQMAREIERLKEEINKKRKDSQADSEKRFTGKPPRGGNRSHIPKLKKGSTVTAQRSSSAEAQAALQKQMESLRSDLNDAKLRRSLQNVAEDPEDECGDGQMQNKILQGRLSATEATVRSQTEKMKHYRGMLQDAGLFPRSPVRSCSESNLLSSQASQAAVLGPIRSMSASSDNLQRATLSMSPGPSHRGLNLSFFQSYGQTEDALQLQEQVEELKGCLGQANQLIHQLKEQLHQSKQQALGGAVSSTVQPPTTGDVSITAASFALPDQVDGMPMTPGFERTKAQNEAAFRRLQAEVMDLHRRLQESEDLNATLQDQLNLTQAGVLLPEDMPLAEQLAQAHRDSRMLQKQLSDSQNQVVKLQQTLADLTEFAEELLHQDEAGEVDVIDISPDRVMRFKQQLSRAEDMASDLADSFHGESHVEAVSPALRSDQQSHDSQDGLAAQLASTQSQESLIARLSSVDPEKTALQDKYQQAQEELRDLQGQLDRLASSHTDNEQSDRELEELHQQLEELEGDNEGMKQQLADLQDENDELKQKLDSLEQEKTTLQQQADKVQHDNAALHQQLQQIGDEKAAAEQQIADLMQERETMQQAVLEREEAVESLETENEQLKQVIIALEDENAGMKNEALQQETAFNQLKQECLDLEDRVSGLLHDAKEHAKMQQEFDQLRQDFEEMSKNAQQTGLLKNELNQLQQSICQKSQLISQLQQDLLSKEQATDRLQQQLAGKEQEQRQLQDHLAKKEQQNSQQQLTDRTIAGQMKQSVADKDRVIAELKQLLVKNQKMADTLRQELNRMGGEIEDKNNAIRKLRKKLHDLQKQLVTLNQSAVTSIPSPTLSEMAEVFVPSAAQTATSSVPKVKVDRASPGDQVDSQTGSSTQPNLLSGNGSLQPNDTMSSVGSVERVRHPTTASSAPTLSPIRGGLSMLEDDIPDTSQGQGRTSRESPLPSKDQMDFARYVSESSGRVDLDRLDLLDLAEPPKRQITLGADSQEDEVMAQVAPSSFSGKKVFDLSRGSHSESPVHDRSQELAELSQIQLDALKTRLQAVEDLNETLKSEVKLYERLHESEGVQTSASIAGKSPSRTSLSIQEHLEEMRALRRRLEESLSQNDRLMEKLEDKLSHKHKGTLHMYLHDIRQQRSSPAGEPDDQDSDVLGLRRRLLDLEEEGRSLRRQLAEADKQLKDVNKLNRDMRSRLDELAMGKQQLQDQLKQALGEGQQLRAALEDRQRELKGARKDLRRLKEEVNHLQEQMSENRDLNKALQMELSMYDKLQGNKENKQAGTDADLDLALLIEEIGRLRAMLETAIAKNGELRQKLQEVLDVSPASSLHVSINHLHNVGKGETSPPQQAYEQNFGAQRSPAPTYRQDRFTTPSDPQGDSEPLTLDLLTHDAEPSQVAAPASHSPPTRLQDATNSHRGSPHQFKPEYRHDRDANVQRQLFAKPPPANIHGSQSLPTADRKDAKWRYHGNPGDSARYSVLDPQRPPREVIIGAREGANISMPITNNMSMVTGSVSTPLRVGSDLRCLYAIGEIDDYELLKKQISESHVVVHGIERRLQERLQAYAAYNTSQRVKSLDYTTMKEVVASLANLWVFLKEEQRLISLFWLSQLPRKENGEIVDYKELQEQNEELQKELFTIKCKYNNYKKARHNSHNHRNLLNEDLFGSLVHAHADIRKARVTIESKQHPDKTQHSNPSSA